MRPPGGSDLICFRSHAEASGNGGRVCAISVHFLAWHPGCHFVARRSWQELVDDNGCLAVCRRDLFRLVHGGFANGGLSALLSHFPGYDQVIWAGAFKTTVELAAQVWARFEELVGHWPWRLLRAVPEGSPIDTLVLQDFVQDDGCCLDESFSEPLRQACPTWEAMQAPSVADALRAVGRRALATNMQLEGLLAQSKGSCPTRKGRPPNVEALAYTSSLAQLLHDHFKRGGANLFQTSRSDLIAAGAPVVNHILNPRQRLDVAWVNKQVAQWRSAHPHATEEDVANARSDYFRRKRNMPAAEWADIVRDMAADSGGLDSSATPGVDSPTWCSGDSRWPVQPSVVSSFLAGPAGGLASSANRVRWRNRRKLIVKDEGRIPPSRLFVKRYACSERHPGLCFTQDADVYRRVIAAAPSFERFFTKDSVGSFFMFWDARADSDSFAVFFAHRRERKPYAQQVAVFVWCKVLDVAGADAGDTHLVLDELYDGSERYNFVSVWGLIKSFLTKGWQTIRVSPLSVEWLPGRPYVRLDEVPEGPLR